MVVEDVRNERVVVAQSCCSTFIASLFCKSAEQKDLPYIKNFQAKCFI